MKFISQTNRNSNGFYATLLMFVIIFSACNSAKQVAYFQDVADSLDVQKRVRNTAYQEVIINKGDILNVEITTIDSKIGGIANQEQTAVSGGGNDFLPGYMVDKNGYVEVPIIGKLLVEGKTTMEIKELVREKALKFYKDPLINIRLVNFYITVLGEVRNPGRFIVSTEKINVIDAIGLAGDLTLGGKRGNVIVIREENGESVFTRVNLNSTDIFQSKYFYLQSGDKIYVEPLKSFARAGTSDQRADRFVGLALGVVSVAVATIGLLIRLQQ